MSIEPYRNPLDCARPRPQFGGLWYSFKEINND